MANALYRQLNNGEWMRQDGGGPAYFKIAMNPTDGLWYPQFTYGDDHWFIFFPATPFTGQADAQNHLNSYMASMNAGTA